MTNIITDRRSMRQAALTAGISILIMTVAAILATGITLGNLIVDGDPLTTAQNIANAPGQFRAGLFCWLIILICDIFAAWGLFEFFRPVNRGISLASGWFRLGYAAILGAAIMNLLFVQIMIGSGGTDLPIDAEMAEQVMLYLDGFHAVWSMGLVIFGIHIVLLGYLILRSTYTPRIFGWLLLIAGIGYLLTHLGKLFLPDQQELVNTVEMIFILPMMSEVALGIWLLIKGRLTDS